LFNVNSSKYLFKITNNYHEEGAAKFSVIVEISLIIIYIFIYIRYFKRSYSHVDVREVKFNSHIELVGHWKYAIYIEEQCKLIRKNV